MAIKLTAERVKRAQPKAGGARVLRDSEAKGLILRVRPSGSRTYAFQYRAGKGRAAPQRMITIGNAHDVSLSEAREFALRYAAQVRAGGDPVQQKKDVALDQRMRLGVALKTYEASLMTRGVVNVRSVMSALRRQALTKLGEDRRLPDITRLDLTMVLAALEAEGLPGAANHLRKSLTGFLNWAVNEGFIQGSPLAGWKKQRQTRAQIVARPGRKLADAELPLLWEACATVDAPFGAYVSILLLTGQRRRETALMRWSNLDLEAGVWTIPAAITKNGRAHRVPLGSLALNIIGHQPCLLRCPYVFANSRLNGPVAGFEARTRQLRKLTIAAGMEHWTLHDLRRTFRSGLSDLGFNPGLCEILLNHTRADLIERYDRAEYWPKRVEAANRWERHVAGLVGEIADRGAIIDITEARG